MSGHNKKGVLVTKFANLYGGVKKKLVLKLDKVRNKSLTITQQEQKR